MAPAGPDEVVAKDSVERLYGEPGGYRQWRHTYMQTETRTYQFPWWISAFKCSDGMTTHYRIGVRRCDSSRPLRARFAASEECP